jgi:hypothetical protein
MMSPLIAPRAGLHVAPAQGGEHVMVGESKVDRPVRSVDEPVNERRQIGAALPPQAPDDPRRAFPNPPPDSKFPNRRGLIKARIVGFGRTSSVFSCVTRRTASRTGMGLTPNIAARPRGHRLPREKAAFTDRLAQPLTVCS